MSTSSLTTSTASNADQLVGGKFEEAQAYAASAWAAAQNYLNQLTSLVAHPSINTNINIPFYYSGGDVISSLLGDKPVKPTIDTNISAVKPILGTMKELPAFDYLTGEIDTLRANVLTKINAIVLSGGTGLDATVEALIWARARSRQEIDNLRQYDEAEKFFSSRGFTLPTGALAGRLNEISIEIARNNSYLNNDISIEQARLAQTNTHFAYEKGASIAIDMMKASLEAVLQYNKGTVEVFIAEVERYKQDITSQIAIIEAQVKVYAAEADAYKSLGIVASVELEAQIKNLELQLKKAEIQSNLWMKEAELELEAATKLHALQVEAIKAGGQVYAQLAASALSCVNATASYGFSGGVSLSASDQTVNSDSSSESTQYIHEYSET